MCICFLFNIWKNMTQNSKVRMFFRLRVLKLLLSLKYADLSISKQVYKQPLIASSKHYCIGTPQSSPKICISISLGTSFDESLMPSLMQTRKSKCSRHPMSKSPKDPGKTKISFKAVSGNVKDFVVRRYIDYVQNYDTILKRKFPAAFKLYHTFFDGFSDFYHDTKWYVKVWRLVHNSPDGLRTLNLKELELYMQMPQDMVKVAPALIGTSLPIIGYAFFTLVFMYPRQLLTSHFWTPEQRDEFQCMQLQKRFMNSNLIICRLNENLRTIKEPIQSSELERILAIMDCKSTGSPTTHDLIGVKYLFATPPYSLQSLSRKHLKLLTGMHGLRVRFRSRLKLKEHATLIQHMDRAIEREGGVHNMPLASLKKACVIRGLNPDSMSKKDLIFWLEKWISVTTSIQEEHMSLLLHLPIFLAFNHPNNLRLFDRSKSFGSNLKQ